MPEHWPISTWQSAIYEVTPLPLPPELSALNTAAADYNIFVSADDQELFFSSNRASSGIYQLYRSLRTCP